MTDNTFEGQRARALSTQGKVTYDKVLENQKTMEDQTLIIDRALGNIADEIYQDYAQYLEEITKGQFRDIIGQLIQSGDIMVYKSLDLSRMRMEYIPFRREQELLGRIRELEEEVKQVSFYQKS